MEGGGEAASTSSWFLRMSAGWEHLLDLMRRRSKGRSEDYMDDQEHVTPLLRVASMLGLSVKEATFLIQMVEDMDKDSTGAIPAPLVLTYYGLCEEEEEDDESISRGVREVLGQVLFASSILRKPLLTHTEVLVVLYNFCTLTKKRGLADYTFQVLDDLGGGSIDREVLVKDFVPKLHGQGQEPGQEADEGVEDLIRRVNKVISTTRTGTVTLEDFRRVVKRVPDLLKPLVDAQRLLHTRCMGYKFWKGHIDQRSRRYPETDQPGLLILELLEGSGLWSKTLDLAKLEAIGGGSNTNKTTATQQGQAGKGPVVDPNELDFETPRLQTFEEAYRRELAHLMAEKRKLEKRKRGVLGASLEGLKEAAPQNLTNLNRLWAPPKEKGRVGEEGGGEEEEEEAVQVPRQGPWWREEGFGEGEEVVGGDGDGLLKVEAEVAEILTEVGKKRSKAHDLLTQILTLNSSPPPVPPAE